MTDAMLVRVQDASASESGCDGAGASVQVRTFYGQDIRCVLSVSLEQSVSLKDPSVAI